MRHLQQFHDYLFDKPMPTGILRALASLSILLMVVVLGGCVAGNPVDPDDDHFEPVGLVLRAGDSELVRYEHGAVSGAIEIATGTTTPRLTVLFILEDGRAVAPPDDELKLDVSIADPGIAQLDGSSAGDWMFALRGISAGATSIVISAMHNGHADFQTKAIPVLVNP